MPHIETVSELVEDLADQMMIYSSDMCHVVDCGCREEFGDHDEECGCRNCFVIGMERRIRESVANEAALKRVGFTRGVCNECEKDVQVCQCVDDDAVKADE